MIRRPLVATEANRNVVMPPSTAEGIDTRAAANLLKIPMMSSQKQAAYPAFRLAHRSTYNHPIVLCKYRHRSNDIFSDQISCIIIDTYRPAMSPFNPSASTPPWMRLLNVAPSTWRRDTSQVAVMSPMASIAKTMYTMKLATGAASIPLRSKYPHAAATIHPTSKPMTTAQDFMIGLPKRSVKMMLTKTRNPRRDEQLPLPPAQSWKPELINDTPISMTVGTAREDDRRRDDACKHSKGVLETQ
ncbi:Xanthine/uracil permease, partial [Aureobasidium melanogenum]